MFLFNLSWIEFGVLFGVIGSATVALYLLTRMRRRLVVSTLRFWQAAQQDLERKRRRRIDQPWSLLLQLLALACLLLAIAQPRWGARAGSGLDHVLIIDHSAWSGARASNGTLLDEARRSAAAWLATLPREDRVMLVEASGLATPVTAFEEDRAKTRAALASIEPSAMALDLEPAFDLARQALRLPGHRPGEIVYAGSARSLDTSALNAPANLRWLPVNEKPVNTALSRVLLRRDFVDPERWEATITVRNDSPAGRQVPLTVGVGGALVHTELLSLPAGSESSSTFGFRVGAAGWLEARADSRDALAADNRVSVELPAPKRHVVAIYSSEPSQWEPLIQSAPHLRPMFLSPAEHGKPVEADLLILDRFTPERAPTLPALVIESAARAQGGLAVTRWNTQHPATRGLRTRDLRLPPAVPIPALPGETVLIETAAGAVAAAREQACRQSH